MNYDEVASFYELWSKDDPANDSTLHFYLSHSEKTGGRILEIGAGLGRITLEIAKHCQQVVALEKSQAMFRRLETAIADSEFAKVIHARNDDIFDFDSSEQFDSIIIPLRTIGLFHTAALRSELLRKCFDLLKSGGSLIFDHFVFRAQPEGDGLLKQVAEDCREDGSSLLFHSHKTDLENQLLRCSLIKEDFSAEGLSVARRFISYNLAWITPDEVRHSARSIGYQSVEVFGGFRAETFGEDSSEQVWVLSR